MEAKTYLKNLRISPKKLRFMLPEIKKMTPSQIMAKLYYSPNRSSKIFYSSIKSAITNAVNVLKVEEKNLRFKHLSIEEGQKLKRYKAGGRGTAKPILKRFSHIKIILEAEELKAEQVTRSKLQETKKMLTLSPKSKTLNNSKIRNSKLKTKSKKD